MSAEPLSNLVELAPKDESPAEKLERDVYRFIKANAGLVAGHDPLASCLRIDSGDLTRALGFKGRYLAIEHFMRLGQRLSERPETRTAAHQLAAAVLKPFDLIVFPRVQLTAAEQSSRPGPPRDTPAADCPRRAAGHVVPPAALLDTAKIEDDFSALDLASRV